MAGVNNKDNNYGSGRSSDNERERVDDNYNQVSDFRKQQQMVRSRICPFSAPDAPKIDYKDARMLSKFLSERGKMIPSRITSVCYKKQRELSKAVKLARFLAILPYVND